MTEPAGVILEPARGTAAHYLYFLDWAEKKGELPASTVQNWRIASTKVLEIEGDWQDLNVVDLDLEAHLARFEIKRRTSYTSSSLGAYKSRARVGIEAYRKWESGSSDWKPKATTRQSKAKSNNRAATPPPEAPKVETVVPKDEAGGHVPAPRTPFIEYQLPLRPGVRAHLTLPEDFTATEAKRVGRFVESLAFSDQPTGESAE
jgi:hypothetical protein